MLTATAAVRDSHYATDENPWVVSAFPQRLQYSCVITGRADNPFVPLLQNDRQHRADTGELHRILRLEVPVIVKLAERKMNLSEVLRLGAGAIIEFSKSSDEPLELMINNKAIGFGEAVKVGENFGLRISQIGDVKQVIRSLA